VKKKYIEWDLPLAEISEASAKEKNIRHGHPSTLHIWWARRPLASSRATNFASLIDLPDNDFERDEIRKIICNILDWKEIISQDKCIYKAMEYIKKNWQNKSPKILDPFSGGGSIPLEASRLGCDIYCCDYNPIAILIEKATLEWPKKFNKKIHDPNNRKSIDGSDLKINMLEYFVDKWYKIILEQVRDEMKDFYPIDSDGSIPVGYIWARTIPCQNPNCGVEIPLVGQFWLSNKKNKKIAYKPKYDVKNNRIEFDILKDGFINFNPSEGTVIKGTVKCPACLQSFKSPDLRRLSLDGKMGERIIALVLNNPKERGRKYRLANQNDYQVYKNSEDFLNHKIQNWSWMDNPIPDEKIRTPNNKIVTNSNGPFFVHLQPVIYGISTFGDLFNSRQKLSIITIIEKIKMNYDKIIEDCSLLDLTEFDIDSKEFANAIISYLCMGLSKVADRNNLFATYQPSIEGFVNTFGRSALRMNWEHPEIVPIYNTTGYKTAMEWIIEIIGNLSIGNNNSNIDIRKASADDIPFQNEYFDAVFTDPPYYDNVPYADLSDFFYVWIKRCIGDYFPELFNTPLTPKVKECIENESLLRRSYSIKEEDFPSLSIKQKTDFNNLLSDSFKEIYRVLKMDGIATIVYAHKTTAAWEAMLDSLLNAGLVVTASWPLHTETKSRLRAASSAALASSIYMVCRKIERLKVGFYSEIKPQIREMIEKKLQKYWNEGIAGGDFFISAIGPGMEIFSRYESVEKLSGQNVTTAELLDFIRSVSTDFIVNKLLKNTSVTKIDNESEFYLAYRWTYQDNTVEYDDARKLASASGVNLEKLWESDGFVSKSGSNISVLGPKQRNKIDKKSNMVDVMHKSVLLWEKGDRNKLSKLLAETGFGKDPAFKQFCQAIAESLLNGNKEKQLLEGFLIGIDVYTRGKVKTPKDQTDLKQFGGN
jgi:putative DNA methylase